MDDHTSFDTYATAVLSMPALPFGIPNLGSGGMAILALLLAGIGLIIRRPPR